jgi:hypothetical protein
MNPRIIIILSCLPPLFASCDKAREIANDASAKVREKVSSAASATEEPVDPELAKLVDRNDEGAVFRKDLPFPSRIGVNQTTTSDLQMRVFESSAIERRSSNVNGRMTGIEKIERHGDHIRHSRAEMRLTDPTAKDAEGKPKVLAENPLGTPGPGPQRVFHRRNGKWEADAGSGFAVTAQSKDLAPVLDTLLQEHGLAPRPQWFAKRRLRIGDELTLTGDTMPVLIGGGAKGALKLKLESFDAVSGHPCGVFTVTGDYSRRQFPSFDGVFTDEDVTIQSGKVWLSLIHPLVIRWEADTIRTTKTGTKGGQITQSQGTAKITLVREWKTPAG